MDTIRCRPGNQAGETASLFFLFTTTSLTGKNTEYGKEQQAVGHNVKIGFVPYAKQVIA
jgi:hypothetical protein